MLSHKELDRVAILTFSDSGPYDLASSLLRLETARIRHVILHVFAPRFERADLYRALTKVRGLAQSRGLPIFVVIEQEKQRDELRAIGLARSAEFRDSVAAAVVEAQRPPAPAKAAEAAVLGARKVPA